MVLCSSDIPWGRGLGLAQGCATKMGQLKVVKGSSSQYSTSLQSLSRLALSILHSLSMRTLSLALLAPGYQVRYYPRNSIFQNNNWPAHLSFLISFHCLLVSTDHLCPGLRISWPTGSSTKVFAGSGWPLCFSKIQMGRNKGFARQEHV